MVFPSEYTETSRVIVAGPCVVRSVVVSGDGASANCQVYDGVNALGKLKVWIAALDHMTGDWRPPGGVLFHAGIYIAVNASTTKVTVTFEPESRK